MASSGIWDAVGYICFSECFRRQMERFIDFGEDKAIMVNNADWLLDLNYIELLREVGTWNPHQFHLSDRSLHLPAAVH